MTDPRRPDLLSAPEGSTRPARRRAVLGSLMIIAGFLGSAATVGLAEAIGTLILRPGQHGELVPLIATGLPLILAGFVVLFWRLRPPVC